MGSQLMLKTKQDRMEVFHSVMFLSLHLNWWQTKLTSWLQTLYFGLVMSHLTISGITHSPTKNATKHGCSILCKKILTNGLLTHLRVIMTSDWWSTPKTLTKRILSFLTSQITGKPGFQKMQSRSLWLMGTIVTFSKHLMALSTQMLKSLQLIQKPATTLTFIWCHNEMIQEVFLLGLKKHFTLWNLLARSVSL